MSRWLPSGLSALSGQLSSFTKEVLAEGVEEVDDHATELRSAKSRIAELEETCSLQKSELERVKHMNDELGVRLQSYELQRATLTNQYRTQLDQKEKEIKLLKQQLTDYVAHSSTELPMLSVASDSVPINADIHSDDISDMISSQREINNLRNDVRRLSAEVQHWRQMSSESKQSIPTATADNEADKTVNVTLLQNQIKELRRQLTETIDRNQHEMSALQGAHRQATASLKSSYSATIDQLKKQLADVSVPMSPDSQEVHSLRQQLKEFETIRMKLEFDLGHTHAADHKKAVVIGELTEQLKSVQSECAKLAEQVTALNEEKREMMNSVHELSDERRALMIEVNTLKQKCKDGEQELETLKAAVSKKVVEVDDSESATNRPLTSTPIVDRHRRDEDRRYIDMSNSDVNLSEEYAELTLQNQQLGEQVHQLRSRIEAYEQEMEQFELVKSDWEMEKDSLEGVLVKLRNELKQKENVLNIVQAQKDIEQAETNSSSHAVRRKRSNDKGLIEAARGQGVLPAMSVPDAVSDDEDMDVETHANMLTQQVDLLTSGSAMMEQERNRLLVENEKLMTQLKEQREEIASLEKRLQSSTDVERNLSNVQSELQAKVVEIEKLRAELNVMSSKNDALASDYKTRIDEMSSRTEQLQTEIENLLKARALSEQQLERNRLDLEKASSEKQNLRTEMESVKLEWATETKKLEQALDELDSEHQKAVAELVDQRDKLAVVNKELKSQLEELQIKQSERNCAKNFNDDEQPSEEEDASVLLSSRTIATQAAEIARLSDVAHVRALETSHLSSECDSLKSTLKSRCDELSALQEELRKLQSVSDSREREHGERVAGLLKELEKLRLDVKADDSLHRQANAQPESGDVSASLALLREDNAALKQNIEEIESVSKLYEAEVERLTQLEEQRNVELSSVKAELQGLRQEILLLRQTEAENSQANNSGEVDDEVRRLQSQLTEIKSLQAENAELKTKADQLTNEIFQLKMQLSEQQQQKYVETDNVQLQSAAKKAAAKTTTTAAEDSVCIENGVQNDDNISSSSSSGTELSRLHSTVAHQNDLIDTLNSKYASLLALLEDRSQAIHGNSMLVDVHNLETEARQLRADRERLVAVLGEKTREASALRNEVHRLTAAAAATQAALTKTQRDVANMMNNGVASGTQRGDEPNQDMKSEAVKRLSQMIRDKDMEIEALKMKTATLLQVLQDSAPDNSKVAALFNETDTLKGQLAIYQRDREQLINALTLKHQESVRFYEEAQQLAAKLTELSAELQQSKQAHDSLAQLYEEKQRSLFTALNELSTLRQRRSELERLLTNRSDTASKEDQTKTAAAAAPSATFTMDSDDEQLQQQPDTLSHASSSENLASEIRRLKDVVAELELGVVERDKRIVQLEQAVSNREKLLEEKQQEVIDKATKLRNLEELLVTRNSELNTLRKQCDSLSFDLQGASGEQSQLINELNLLRRQVESVSGELHAQKSSNVALTAGIAQKDFEISSLKEQLSSFGKLVESTGGGHGDEQREGEMRMLSTQLEGLRRQIDILQRERDQACQQLYQLQNECIELKNKVAFSSEREGRLAKECERLRGHLVQIEESYTREALDAEEREKQLRNRLVAAEETVLSSSSTIQNIRLESAKQIENLQIQLHAIAEQRDNALFQLSSAQETVASYANSLSNLQMVLEQFQAERLNQQSVEVERYKRDAQRERDDAQKLRDQIGVLQTELEEASNALEAAHRLSEQLDRKESAIAALREEVHIREMELKKAEEQVRKLTSSTEAKIDKIIIKNLLLGYFHTPPSKRQEALMVIGQVLSYSREEMTEIASLNVRSEGGWIGGLFRKKSSSGSSSSTSQGNPYSSFSEMFVRFLERESSPQPSPADMPKLPADRMIQEKQQQQPRRAAAAFNPFSTSVIDPTTPSLLVSSNQSSTPIAVPIASTDQSSHPLMRPITQSNLPVFAPVTANSVYVASLSSSGRSQQQQQQQQQDSTDSSGRSTPSSSAILRDLLQQR